ncbi:uroporphyrinogen-III synthase [Salimicrobium flavidum]|uniref:Uroporphyrinogen-III synthase n=1 Tax=Salimicrobium flavidum TaxID=570947 RepID=A0A1N7JNE4_9BACI|nr:uroporphyrinogen-III synthase [Salimicrobium flavidum]SIS50830.1 uroporphyrinogen-III synthase [Salimicrobium flavidum]
MSVLSGKEVLITRASSQADPLKKRLISRGAGVTLLPLLTFVKRKTRENFRLLNKLDTYDWVLLTSSNGVRFFEELLWDAGVRAPYHLKYAVVGPKTELALEERGMSAAFLPSVYSAETLVKEWIPQLKARERILYVRGNLSRETIREGLNHQHISFDSLTAYDTLIVEENEYDVQYGLKHREWEALTFFSPSAVDAFYKLAGPYINEGLHLPCFCIGPTTEQKAVQLGFSNISTPGTYTAEALVETMEEYFTEKG